MKREDHNSAYTYAIWVLEFECTDKGAYIIGSSPAW